MKTKIIKQEEPKTEWKFPCLGRVKDTTLVVLFTDFRKGTVIIPSEKHPDYGWVSTDWNMDNFTPITEPTTIKFIP